MTKTELSNLASKIPVWPEWNDNDITNERWLQDTSSPTSWEKRGVPAVVLAYEDRDGRDWLPQSYGIVRWKRPAEYLNQRYICVNDVNCDIDFDLISANKHLSSNELMRSIISQIISLTNMSIRKNYTPEAVGNSYTPPENTSWRPWHHVYALCKAGKVPHVPQYNPWGKYAVRLYWLGCWRKIYVDDYIPTTKDGKALLPFTHNGFELWPALLVKALMKVASLESTMTEDRDFSAIEHLTGWIPERIVLYRHYLFEMWDVIISCFSKGETLSQSSIGAEKRRASKRSPRLNIQDVDGDFPCMAVFAEMCNYSHQGSSTAFRQMKSILQPFNYVPEMKHSIYLPEYRTRPLQPPKLPENTPKWKLIRRHLWDENYISKEELEKPIKVLGLYLPWSYPESISSDDSMSGSAGSHVHLKQRKVKDTSKFADAIPVQWISYEDFCKCFNKICVYHKSSAYVYCYKLLDSKTINKAKLSTTKLITINAPLSVYAFTDGVPFFLFSDNLAPTEILLAISIASAVTEVSLHKPGPYDSSISVYSCGCSNQLVPSGCILVESFDSQKQISMQTILTVKTAASKASMLVLPPGRHVLSITVRSTFGCVVTVCSNSAIVVGDEDVIYPKISSESLRFQEQSKELLGNLIESFASFSNPGDFKECQKRLYQLVCPTRKGIAKQKGDNNKYSEHFNIAICSLITRIVDNLSIDLKFALRAFTFLPYETDLFSEAKIRNRKRRLSSVFSLYDELPSFPSSLDLNYTARTAFDEDLVMVQSCVRRFLVQNLIKSRQEGKYNSRVAEQLTKLIPILEKNRPDGGYFLLRNYFHLTPKVIKHFSFWNDEPNSVLLYDYSGTVQVPLQIKTWIVVYRDVLYVTDKTVKITPCIQCDSVTWARHLIDNDTLQEVSDSIAKTCQSTFPRNKFGYTILIRVYSTALRIGDLKWSLRMISPIGSMYVPLRRDAIPTLPLIVREIYDYYCPHKNQIITRYAINSPSECIVSIQFMVSSPRVKLQVNVYEENLKIISVRDKSHVIVPAVYLHKVNSADYSTLFYYVEAKILNESWAVADFNIPFIQTLQYKEKMELHLGLAALSQSEATKSTTAAEAMHPRISKKRYADNRAESTGNKPPLDPSRPHWFLRIISDNSVADSLNIHRDTRRIEEICTVKRKWEIDNPGRFTAAYEVRAKFLELYSSSSHSLPTPSGQRIMPDGSIMSTISDVSDSDRKISIRSDAIGFRSSASEDLSVASTVPPRYIIPHPLQTKIELKPWDTTRFIRRLKPERPMLKDNSVQNFQTLVHNRICANFVSWRENMDQRIEQVKTKQLSEKHLLFDRCEQWQMTLEEKRNRVLSDREKYREKIIEMEEAARLAHLSILDEGKVSPGGTSGDRRGTKKKI